MKISGVKMSRTMEQKELKQNSTTIFVGNSKVADPTKSLIQQRKAQAQKQALKVVSDVLNGQKKVDESKSKAQERIQSYHENQEEARTQIEKLEKQKEVINNAEDETEEFRKSALDEIDVMEEQWRQEDKINQVKIRGENAALVDSKIEQLKSHAMVDATKSADVIMQASQKDIIGIAMEAAREKVEEDFNEKVEAAKKKGEEEKTKEEKREKEKESTAEITENIVKNASALDENSEEWKRKLKELADKMHLTEEDLKGIRVDENI